jgi:hypothetical protein
MDRAYAELVLIFKQAVSEDEFKHLEAALRLADDRRAGGLGRRAPRPRRS